LTIGTVMKGYTTLDEQKIRVPRPFNFVIHPRAWYYFAVATTSNSTYGVQGDLGNDVLKKFYETTLLGDVRVYRDPQISISSSVAVCGMFNKDALGLWRPRKFRLKTDEDIDLRAVKLVSSTRAGSCELIDAFGVKISLYAGAL